MLKTFENFIRYNNKSDNLIKYKIKLNELENIYKYFHVSTNYLIDNNDNKTFTFTAKIPYQPFTDDDGNTIEDDFTNRVSLATDIKSCLIALPNDDDDNILYLYGIDLKYTTTDDIETINLKNIIDKCPIIKGKKYGVDFNLDDWLKSLSKIQFKELQQLFFNQLIIDQPDLKDNIIYTDIDLEEFIHSPSDLPEKYKKLFFACVPDADETNEFWSLNNLKMDYLGEFEGINDDFAILKIKKEENIPIVIKNLKNSNKLIKNK